MLDQHYSLHSIVGLRLFLFPNVRRGEGIQQTENEGDELSSNGSFDLI